MATIFERFDHTKTAFINPEDTIVAEPGFPEVCITTFSNTMIDKFVSLNQAEKIAELYTANGITPIYGISYKGKRIALFLSRVGAPACIAGLEEVIAMGVKKIVLFGCCGVLNQQALAKCSLDTAVVTICLVIYVNLPPHAAVIPAGRADTFKSMIIVRCPALHFMPP